MSRFGPGAATGAGPAWWRRLRFGDVVLLTAVPLVAAAYLVAGALNDYENAHRFDDWWSRAKSVSGAFRDRLRVMVNTPAAIALERDFAPDPADAGTVSLLVEQDAWNAVTTDPLAGFDTWVDAQLDRGSSLEAVRLRKRGDNSIHWTTPKTTFTLRTARTDLFKGYRQLGFSGKDVLFSYLANQLPREFGLLVPETRVVPVYLNRRFYGLFRMIVSPDESFLRPNDRMPGNIFRGDAAERGEYYKDQVRDLFANLYIWDRTAFNDRPTSAGATQLRLLLEDVNGTTFAEHQRLMARIDRDEVTRLLAVMLLLGDPYHMDGVHNQFWYEDPSTQLLTPIAWDLRLLDLRQPTIRLNRFLRAALRDPFLVDGTLREVGRRTAGGAFLRLADSLVHEPWDRYQGYFRYERMRRGLIPDVGTPDSALGLLRGNVAFLETWMDDAALVAGSGAAAAGGTVLDVETRGYAGADLVALDVAGAATGGAVRLDRNRNGVLDAGDPTLPGTWSRTGNGLRFVPGAPLAFLPAWTDAGRGRIAPAPVHYRLFVAAAGKVTLEARNRVTGKPAQVSDWPAGQPVSATTAWSPWQYPERRPVTHRWSGEVRLTETVRIPAGDTLLVAPGTTVRMAPDVSIVSQGLMLARGTPDRPIRFVRLDPTRPWGTVSLLGHGADRSVWQHAEFIGGGGALVDRIEYIGMTNVHRVDSVLVDHVLFQENVRSDDTFHALHASVTLSNSRFVRANSDAVDFDISSGFIVGNRFEASGGDAIDLMTSTPVVAGNHIRGSADKGISVGEASRPVIFANDIAECDRGIEIKDGSEPLIVNNLVARNRTGIRADRKNWRYGHGGWGRLVNTLVLDSRRKVTDIDSVSRLTLAATRLGDDSASLADTTGGLDWLYRRYGFVTDDRRPGLPARWSLGPAVAPVAEVRYEDDFGAEQAGWVGDEVIQRIERRSRALVVSLRDLPGTVAHSVDWNLPAGGTLVLELGGTDLRQVEVSARAAGRATTLAVAPPFTDTRFRFVALALPPGRYDRLALRITPVPGLTKVQQKTGLLEARPARLLVRGWSVVPAAGGTATALR